MRHFEISNIVIQWSLLLGHKNPSQNQKASAFRLQKNFEVNMKVTTNSNHYRDLRAIVLMGIFLVQADQVLRQKVALPWRKLSHSSLLNDKLVDFGVSASDDPDGSGDCLVIHIM